MNRPPARASLAPSHILYQYHLVKPVIKYTHFLLKRKKAAKQTIQGHQDGHFGTAVRALLYHGLHCFTSAPCRSVLVSNWRIYNCQDWVKFFQVSQAYVRQPHPSQTTYKPHETKRPQPTINRLYETKVPCGAAYIIWPRKAVSLNICACQYCTPTEPNTFSTDHAPPRNTASYRQAATNCSTLHQRRHSTARPLLLQPPRPPRTRFLHRLGFYQGRTGRSLRTRVRKQRGFQMI